MMDLNDQLIIYLLTFIYYIYIFKEGKWKESNIRINIKIRKKIMVVSIIEPRTIYKIQQNLQIRTHQN
jgi:hypothetical protein